MTLHDLMKKAATDPKNLTTSHGSPVFEAFLDVIRFEATNNVKFSNKKVAEMIRATVANSQTTHKSVASYRSKNKDLITQIKNEINNS